MKIIADLKGFTLAHRIIVIDENDIKTVTQASMKNMPEVICDLAQRYNCNQISLLGNTKYTKEIGNKINNTFTAKFNCKCPFEIEYNK